MSSNDKEVAVDKATENDNADAKAEVKGVKRPADVSLKKKHVYKSNFLLTFKHHQ